ncbi:ATP-binding protein [Actinokineospora fastidiosa]|uniref:LuxR family transcriptional regulator n=1 Tax=Actinokineospora fastidiosa TaxID=1816 RepID=A0A918GHE2_9PSEU|nr:LuxR C-terminal-related transcriptional regulator [Actinokineospora fastidiosa]GGS36411.1 LuxR family transcriptional regulator [Actinokineospora fastidiosa]
MATAGGGVKAERTSYVGRAREIAQARRLLNRGRLVTLTGPGGVGKTRLALRVARSARYADGTVFVELADLRDPALVAGAVAGALGLRALSGRPGLSLVVDHLADREVLLLLDNCEHVLDACAELAVAVLAGCPRVGVLATSRQSLGAEGEHVLSVPPLSVPEDVDGADENESVRLFADRARAVAPDFEVTDDNRADVVALVRRLEGVPLAIELAAARVRALTPAQIVARLDLRILSRDAGPQRQRSLRATIDWSHDLCTEPERLVWRRASVFSGSFDLEAAEAVCGGDGVDRADVLDLVDGLLDKSVLIREDHSGLLRYRMLETLRQYGHEKLGADADRVARRHRDWYDHLTACFADRWLTAEQLAWLDRLPRELTNIWVALEFCVRTPGEAAVAVRMLDRIRPYWSVFGHMNEVRHYACQAAAQLTEDSREYRVAVWIEGFLAALRGDAELAAKGLFRAAELATAAADDELSADVAFSAGMGMFLADHTAQAIPLLEQALVGYRAAGFPEGLINALCFGGFAHGYNGDYAAARALLDECVAMSEDAGEIYFRSWAMCALGYIHLEADDLAEAERYGRLAVRHGSTTEAWFIVAASIHMLAWTAARGRMFDRAVTLFGAADVIWASIDLQARSFPIWVARLDRHEALTKEALGATAYDRTYSRGRAMSVAAAVDYALGKHRPPPEIVGLTRREQEIAELVAEGLTNREIAERLSIARRTAETHVGHILTKLNLANRAQLAVWVTSRR